MVYIVVKTIIFYLFMCNQYKFLQNGWSLEDNLSLRLLLRVGRNSWPGQNHVLNFQILRYCLLSLNKKYFYV